MGYRATERFTQAFTNSDRIIVYHGLDLEYPAIRVLTNGDVDPEMVVAIAVDQDDPTNRLVVLLDSLQSGEIQITSYDIQPVGVQSATTLALLGQGAKLVFGENYEYEEDLTRSTVTGTTAFTQKLRLSATVPLGTYRIAASFTWDYSSVANNFLARVELDDTTTVWEMVEEPTDTSSTQERYAQGQADVVLDGSHTFDLDFATSSAAQTSGISQARLEFWRV